MCIRDSLKGGLALLFLSLLLLGVITIHTVVQIQSYGKLINYVGIVRGATPVSYTHLDVYKRQRKDWAIPAGSPKRWTRSASVAWG